MRVQFDATEVGFSVADEAVICGVANGREHLVFQRAAEHAAEDPGVHLEYSEQVNGDYRCVASCRLSSRMLSVDLSRPLGALVGVDGFDVALSVSAESLERLKSGLREVFRGTSGTLHVA